MTDSTQLIVVASIHQPSTTTFQLFDKLLLLSEGKTCYAGLIENAKDHFSSIGFEMPVMMNPGTFTMHLHGTDL